MTKPPSNNSYPLRYKKQTLPTKPYTIRISIYPYTNPHPATDIKILLPPTQPLTHQIAVGGQWIRPSWRDQTLRSMNSHPPWGHCSEWLVRLLVTSRLVVGWCENGQVWVRCGVGILGVGLGVGGKIKEWIGVGIG